MKKRKAPLWGNVVKTVQHGNTTIHICDDCIERDPVKHEHIVKEFYAAGYRLLQATHKKHIRLIYERGFEANQKIANTISSRHVPRNAVHRLNWNKPLKPIR